MEFSLVLVMKISVLEDIMPSSSLKFNRRIGVTCRLHHQCQRIRFACYLLHSVFFFFAWLIIRFEHGTICWPETSVDFQRATWRYKPEGL
jgi:hypothetical protein